MVVRAGRRVAGGVVVFGWIRHVGGHGVGGHRGVGGDRDGSVADLDDASIDHDYDNASEHDNAGEHDNASEHDNYATLDKHLHNTCGRIDGHRNACHRPVGARARHHCVSHR